MLINFFKNTKHIPPVQKYRIWSSILDLSICQLFWLSSLQSLEFKKYVNNNISTDLNYLWCCFDEFFSPNSAFWIIRILFNRRIISFRSKYRTKKWKLPSTIWTSFNHQIAGESRCLKLDLKKMGLRAMILWWVGKEFFMHVEDRHIHKAAFFHGQRKTQVHISTSDITFTEFLLLCSDLPANKFQIHFM